NSRPEVLLASNHPAFGLAWIRCPTAAHFAFCITGIRCRGEGGPVPVVEELRASDPAQLGKYRLIGRLGDGGMGEVYLARSPGGRKVAVKVIKAELAQ